MSSLALYRKYRSKSFDELIGQDHITTVLKRSIESSSFSHAYLFTGPRGVGKTSAARLMAVALNKYEDQSSDHIDVIEIDAASNRRIDEIRELREKAYIAPVEAEFKVYIIDEVHMLTTEAFNALLKTLEEPPAHCIFILATTEVHKLPETIISRTQRHNFQLVDKEVVANYLAKIAKKEKININKDALSLISEQSGGSLRDALSILGHFTSDDQEIDYDRAASSLGLASSELIDTIINQVDTNSKTELVKSLDKINEQGLSVSNVAKQLALKLINKSKEIDGNYTYLELANDLLDCLNGQYVKEKFEIALLKRTGSKAPDAPSSFNLSPSTTVTKKRVETKEKPASKDMPTAVSNDYPQHQSNVSKSEENAKENSKSIDERKPVENISAVKESSSETLEGTALEQSAITNVLDSVKQSNSALYGLMRKARISVVSDTAILEFDFAFHGKRAGDSKNKDIILKAIQSNVESISKIDIKINKKAEKTPVKSDMVKDPAKGIIDTFGGGEIINYD